MMRDKILFIDLDGTIIDASLRLYHLHQDILKQSGFTTPYSREEYLALKRKKTPEREIISFIPKHYQDFYLQQREKYMEYWEHLAKDILFPWSKEALEQLQRHNTLILCTRRKKTGFLLRQLQHLGIDDLFHDYVVSFGQKAEMIERHPLFLPQKAVIIGDTEAEIETGKLLGIKTVAVLSGYRNKEFLESYHPDLIVENIGELIESEMV